MLELVSFITPCFGKARRAVANLGYAAGRWLGPVYVGDTLRSQSEVIGLKQNSNGKTGLVYVRTQGKNQHNQIVLDYVRWVMVRKRNHDAEAPQTLIPQLDAVLSPSQLQVPQGLDFSRYDFVQAGEPHRWGDYQIGEKIDHIDGDAYNNLKENLRVLCPNCHSLTKTFKNVGSRKSTRVNRVSSSLTGSSIII